MKAVTEEGFEEIGKEPSRTASEIKADRENYRRRKKKILELENRNAKYLYLIPTSDINANKKKFYLLGGNSAIIYVHELASRIGKKNVFLRNDLDKGEKFYSGVCSIVNIESATEKFEKIGIKRQPDVDGILVFKLAREYPKSEIREMLKLEQKRVEALNNLIFSERLYPDIYKDILTLTKQFPPKIKNMEANYRALLGEKMLEPLMELNLAYIQMTRGDLEVKAVGKKMMECADRILVDLFMLNELKLWDVAVCTRIGGTVASLKITIKAEILNK